MLPRRRKGVQGAGEGQCHHRQCTGGDIPRHGTGTCQQTGGASPPRRSPARALRMPLLPPVLNPWAPSCHRPPAAVPRAPLFGVTLSRPAVCCMGAGGGPQAVPIGAGGQKGADGGGCEVTQLSPPPPHSALPAVATPSFHCGRGQGGKYEVIGFSFRNNQFRYSPGVEVAVPGSLCAWWGGACVPQAEPWHRQRSHGRRLLRGSRTLFLAASGPGGEKRGVRGCGRGARG